MGVQIPKSLVENYARSIGTLSDSACKAVARQMSSFAFSDDVAADRNRIQNLMKAVLRPYMDVSVRTTVEFYNIVREWSLGERLDDDVSVDEVDRPDATDGAVRAFMQQAVDGKPENIAPLLMERTAYELKRSAMDTMMALGKKDLARVKFARVPGFSASYGDGCTFCKMLSSRGFVYLSEDTAGTHVHANCTCTVVPGFKGDTVEGYDPQAIGAQWEQEMNDLAEQRAERNGTSSQQEYDLLMRNLGDASKRSKERASVAQRSITETKSTTRERLSLSGRPSVNSMVEYLRAASRSGDITYSKPLEKFIGSSDQNDLFAHVALHRAGYKFVVAAEDSPENFSNIDLLIDGEWFEIKSPDADGSGKDSTRFVEKNLRKAKRQFERMSVKQEKVNVVFNGKYTEVDDNDIYLRIDHEMSRHGIDKVIQVRKDGSVIEH